MANLAVAALKLVGVAANELMTLPNSPADLLGDAPAGDNFALPPGVEPPDGEHLDDMSDIVSILIFLASQTDLCMMRLMVSEIFLVISLLRVRSRRVTGSVTRAVVNTRM